MLSDLGEEGLVPSGRHAQAFRKYVEVAAGWYEPFFSPTRGEWFEIPKSVAFDRMDDAEFRDLYEKVKDVIIRVLDGYMTMDEFDRVLGNF